jgi:ABC-type Zn2+ transport system substrate-binding protein/surface adhesin
MQSSLPPATDDRHVHDGREHVHDHGHGPHRHRGDSHRSHGHSHGLVDRTIVRSRDGVRTVAISLAGLAVAAVAQVVVFIATNSVALLADQYITLEMR